MNKRLGNGTRALLVAAWIILPAAIAAAQAPVAGPNVNMVSGTKWPQGDPFLTKQNEPSLAVSSRNPRHLLAGSNDYRLIPVEIAEELDDPEAWLTLYKSVDGGTSWRSTLLGGCPLAIPECADSTGLTAPLKALAPNFGADPTVRPGPYGTFFVSFIAGTRDTAANGVVAVQRFVDKNNDVQRDTDVRGTDASGNPIVRQAQDPILPDTLNIIDTGTPGQFKDKPWVAADVPGRSWNAGRTCNLLTWTKGQPGVMTDASETVPAFNVYVSYANFVGQSTANQHPQALVAVSTDCGQTFGKPVKLSNSIGANSGTNMAIDPQTGAVYVVWRNFDGPQGIYLSKSTDGGQTWSNKPILVSTFIPYDQAATGVSFRTLAFPTIAVSVKNGVSRVHVAWSQRKAGVGTTSPYACSSATPADCDARVVMTTSTDGGNTWPAPVAVDGSFTVTATQPDGSTYSHSRGHQVQPAMTFAAGKLMITWLDQRYDHTEEALRCVSGSCSSVADLVPVREAKGNLASNCTVTIPATSAAGVPVPPPTGTIGCFTPGAVWTTYITDGTPYLVRRHTLDVFAALADPETRSFAPSKVSQYVFGNTARPGKGTYDIRQKEFNVPNLPMFANGHAAFLGDYIDAAAQTIAATGDPARPYRFNVGGTANDNFTTSGLAPVFYAAFTDNRDVVPPADGNWATPTCLVTGFVKNAAGNITGATDFAGCASAGNSGNRNQNVYSAIVAESAVAFANANSKLLDAAKPRGFVVTVQNLGATARTYNLTILPPAGVTAAFNKESFAPGTETPKTSLPVLVQPRSSATRTVWVTASAGNARIPVQVAAADGSYSSQVVLNPDPGAALVPNGDGTLDDLANNDLSDVVLTNAVLTNNVLTNAALSNNALSNDAFANNVLSNNVLTNAALSNVVLSNAVLSNLQVENLDPGNVALSNAVLTNNVLTNNVLSNVVLSNAVLSNNVLTNNVLSNAVLSNNALTNVALTNIDPANVALSNVVLSNNALTNVVLSNLDPNAALTNAMLSNNALTNAVLTNVVLSNDALANNVLSNNVLTNAVLSNNVLTNNVLTNAPLADTPDALAAVEQANFDLASNPFRATDLAAVSNFADASFTVRNRGNTDTTLAIKMLVRDAACDPATHVCTLPGYKLELILRKISLTPSAIAPTARASAGGQAVRIGLTQTNAQVSNVGAPALVDPEDPNLGRFLPDDPAAATLPLAPGERAYVTLRAIGTDGRTLDDLVELLRWGVKTVAVDASNNTRTRIPLIIRTLTLPAVTAAQPASLTLKTFGGFGAVTGTAECADAKGARIVAPCLPSPTIGPFAADGTATLSFTPYVAGTFYLLVNVSDSSVPAQGDRQLLKVVVNLATPTVSVNTGSPNFPTSIPFGQPFDLSVLLAPPPLISSPSPAPITFATDPASAGVCTVSGTLLTPVGIGTCTFLIQQGATVTYASISVTSPPVPVVPGAQTIAFAPLAPLTYGDAPFMLSATGGASGNPVTFSAPVGAPCSVSGNTVTIVAAGACTITANQAGNALYNAAPSVSQVLTIARAAQTINFGSLAAKTYGDAAFTVSATASSGLVVTFSAPATAGVCTVSGNTVTIVAAGTCTINADQAGNGNYGAAATVSQSFTVAKALVTAQVTVTPSSYTYGDDVAPNPVSVTYGSQYSGLTALCLTSMTPATPSGQPTPPAGTPASAQTYTITPTLAAGQLKPSCTLTTISGTLTVNKAPAAFSGLAAAFVAPYPMTASITGKLNRSDKTSVYPGVADGVGSVFSVTLRKGATTVKTYYPTPGGGDGSFAISDATIPPDSYTLAFAYPGAGNFTGAAPASATLRVEGFTVTGSMVQPRTAHTATLLNDGRVLVAGGFDATGSPTATSEVYCPDSLAAPASAQCPNGTGQFAAVGNLPSKSAGHTATLLLSGKVLAVGGGNSSAEIFDPATNLWTGAGGVSVRSYHTATLLPSGKVFLAGGVDNSGKTIQTTIVFDPATGGSVSGPTLLAARERHTAALLPNGKVLIAGGRQKSGSGYVVLQSTEIYDPGTGTIAPGPAMNFPRFSHSGTLLVDGRVVVAGGSADTITAVAGSQASAEIYANGAWTALPSTSALRQARREFTLTPLVDGRVLAVGGVNATSRLATSELFTPDAFTLGASLVPPPADPSRSSHAATRLLDGRVLVTGGTGGGGGAINSAELYNGPSPQ